MSEIKQGYYWVRSRRFSGAWEVADLDGDRCWYFAGCDDPQPYSFVTEIGDRIPTPEEMEGWHVVPLKPTKEMKDNVLHSCHSVQVLADALAAWPDLLQAAPKPGDV